jgi:hypothetical protein
MVDGARIVTTTSLSDFSARLAAINNGFTGRFTNRLVLVCAAAAYLARNSALMRQLLNS